MIDKDLISLILSDKDTKAGLHISNIVDRIVLLNEGGDDNKETITKRVQTILSQDVRKKGTNVFVKVKNSKTGKERRGYYKLKPTRPTGPVVNPIPAQESAIMPSNPDNLFVGKAGECAVMSELLFKGYNVNTLLVDDGVDVVASKNNVFFLVQVKTCTMSDQHKIYATIKQNRFDAYLGFQIRYIIVARCRISDVDTNIYFTFDNKDLQMFIANGCLLESNSGISVKIKYDKETRTPILYHNNKEQNISFYMNRFDL